MKIKLSIKQNWLNHYFHTWRQAFNEEHRISYWLSSSSLFGKIFAAKLLENSYIRAKNLSPQTYMKCFIWFVCKIYGFHYQLALILCSTKLKPGCLHNDWLNKNLSYVQALKMAEFCNDSGGYRPFIVIFVFFIYCLESFLHNSTRTSFYRAIQMNNLLNKVTWLQHFFRKLLIAKRKRKKKRT